MVNIYSQHLREVILIRYKGLKLKLKKILLAVWHIMQVFPETDLLIMLMLEVCQSGLYEIN